MGNVILKMGDKVIGEVQSITHEVEVRDPAPDNEPIFGRMMSASGTLTMTRPAEHVLNVFIPGLPRRPKSKKKRIQNKWRKQVRAHCLREIERFRGSGITITGWSE